MSEWVKESREKDFSKSCLRPEGNTSGCKDSGIKGIEEIQVGMKQAKVINSHWASRRPVSERRNKRSGGFDTMLEG